MTRTHNLNIGVDYRKPLSRSRRTFLRFRTGSVIAEELETGAVIGEQVETGAGIGDPVEGRRFEATGSASLVHQIGRTWSAQAQYRREVGYLEGFARPVLSDSANGTLGGLLTRRTDFYVNVNYISGASGLRSGSPRFRQLRSVGPSARCVDSKPCRIPRVSLLSLRLQRCGRSARGSATGVQSQWSAGGTEPLAPPDRVRT